LRRREEKKEEERERENKASKTTRANEEGTGAKWKKSSPAWGVESPGGDSGRKWTG
jgi:hypothetical protein